MSGHLLKALRRYVYTKTQTKTILKNGRVTSKFKATQPHTKKSPKHTLTQTVRRKITVSETQNQSKTHTHTHTHNDKKHIKY